MKKAIKIGLIVIGSLVLISVISFGIFLLMNVQDVIDEIEIGDKNNTDKILIASQGSDFKKALVEKVTDKLENNENNYIKVIDVSKLPEVKQNNWNAFVIINSCQASKMNKNVIKFLSDKNDFSNVILIVTSGSGDWKTKKYNIDTITSASKENEIDKIVKKILAELGKIL